MADIRANTNLMPLRDEVETGVDIPQTYEDLITRIKALVGAAARETTELNPYGLTLDEMIEWIKGNRPEYLRGKRLAGGHCE